MCPTALPYGLDFSEGATVIKFGEVAGRRKTRTSLTPMRRNFSGNLKFQKKESCRSTFVFKK